MNGIAVSPKLDCPHESPEDISILLGSISEAFTSCTTAGCVGANDMACGDVSENWICLTCRAICCSRYVNGHMALHNANLGHPVAMSFSDASFWCYSCESYIYSANLRKLALAYGAIKFPHGAPEKLGGLANIPEDDEQSEEGEEETDNGSDNARDEERSQPIAYSYDQQQPLPFSRDEFITGLRDKSFTNIAVLTGAGISVAAGIPDFRSPGTGLYSRLQEFNIPRAESVFDLSYFRENPMPFYTVAKSFLTYEANPVGAHRFIKKIHAESQLLLNFTQNIDGLELAVGLPQDRVIQAHGHMRTAHCIDCKQEYPVSSFLERLLSEEVYYCSDCKDSSSAPLEPESTVHTHTYGQPSADRLHTGLIKPDIVFFGEPLPRSFFESVRRLMSADLVIVMGTSLKVQPFASLLHMIQSSTPVVLINRENPGLDHFGPFLFLPGDIEETIDGIVQELRWEL